VCDGERVRGDDRNPDAVLVEQRLAFPREQVIAVSGLSGRQVDYWARTGLIEPMVDTRVGKGRRIRHYGFIDLLALVVVAQLRKEHGISLQHIRWIVEHLKSRGYREPLTELRFAIFRNRVYFQHPDGQWEGDVRPDQLVLQHVLGLQPLRQRIYDSTRRADGQAGKAESRRGALGGKPLFAGTRVPIDTVRRYLGAGKTVDDVLQAFPDLTRDDVDAVRRGEVA
jgi:DNA-binding transcriptional MerR regulator